MSTFDLKLVPKAKEEITKYVNFTSGKLLDFSKYEGKIVYINAGFPGKHIYSAYYVNNKSASVLVYQGEGEKKETPVFTIDELDFNDPIGFYTVEEWEKYKEDAKKVRDAKNKKP